MTNSSSTNQPNACLTIAATDSRREASHVKLTQATVSKRNPLLLFFSYIWFKYGILCTQRCDWCSLVVSACTFQPSWLGSNCARILIRHSENSRSIHGALRNGKGDARSVPFFLENFALQLGLGQQCQSER